jgi:hypothetical protein
VTDRVPPMTHGAALRNLPGRARTSFLALMVLFAVIVTAGALAYHAGVMSLESAPLWGGPTVEPNKRAQLLLPDRFQNLASAKPAPAARLLRR